MEVKTGHVEICAFRRLPGHGPKCAVCRELLAKDVMCIKVRAQRNTGSQFFMHVGCTAPVLFNLMRAFNYANNGLGKDKTAEDLVLTEAPFDKGGVCVDPVEVKQEAAAPEAAEAPPEEVPEAKATPPKKRGRPAGSKNKPKKRGRPAGSKNKPKKRGPGRPPGRKNRRRTDGKARA